MSPKNINLFLLVVFFFKKWHPFVGENPEKGKDNPGVICEKGILFSGSLISAVYGYSTKISFILYKKKLYFK